MRTRLLISAFLVALAVSAGAQPSDWKAAWPRTDFTRAGVPLGEIISGGVPRDGIPPIDAPRFAPVALVSTMYRGTEPVITVEVKGKARAYPLGILMTHEIVNDELNGVPIAVTYCPLCNAAVVFERNLDGTVYDFGVTGMLRNSDLVMWDRQTESWWQQFTGQAIVGAMTGAKLRRLPTRVESFARFAHRFADGEVLLSPRGGPGSNPYEGYDSAERPFLYRGSFPEGLAPLAYVVAVDGEAWTLDLLRRAGRIESGSLVLSWHAGQNSAMDRRDISTGRDIGNVVVQRVTEHGLRDTAYDVTFAFAFHAFHPGSRIHR